MNARLIFDAMAQALFHANRARRTIDGKDDASRWEDLSEAARQVWLERAMSGMFEGCVDWHDRLRAQKAAQGWTAGPVYSDAQKTDPFLVPFRELPDDVQIRLHVSYAMVGAMFRKFSRIEGEFSRWDRLQSAARRILDVWEEPDPDFAHDTTDTNTKLHLTNPQFADWLGDV